MYWTDIKKELALRRLLLLSLYVCFTSPRFQILQKQSK